MRGQDNSQVPTRADEEEKKALVRYDRRPPQGVYVNLYFKYRVGKKFVVDELDFEEDSWADQSRRGAAASDQSDASVDNRSDEPLGSVNDPVIMRLPPSAPLSGQAVNRANEPLNSINEAVIAGPQQRAHSQNQQVAANANLMQPMANESVDEESDNAESDAHSDDAA